VLDQRIDDLAEGGADDHADGEIEDVAAHREVTKVLQHVPLPDGASAAAAGRPRPRQRVGRSRADLARVGEYWKGGVVS